MEKIYPDDIGYIGVIAQSISQGAEHRDLVIRTMLDIEQAVNQGPDYSGTKVFIVGYNVMPEIADRLVNHFEPVENVADIERGYLGKVLGLSVLASSKVPADSISCALLLPDGDTVFVAAACSMLIK